MLGSVSAFCHGIARLGANELRKLEYARLFLGAVEALAREVDLIGWHPFYQTDPDSPEVRDYAGDVRALRRWCEGQGFRGDYMATEYNWGANYPVPAKPRPCLTASLDLR